ncbi:MAG: DUF4136 domain-containing protein [Paraburkholderia sp.]|uniref:DUF4136 domain-containing protein n=1 Tax=Paraburkholderia sp. TaxID=1926495 RepID=UPI003C5F6A97
MKITAIRVALIAAVLSAALSGCASVSADVQASNQGGDWQGARTYTLARTPLQDASADHTQYEAMVRAELEKYGFADTFGQGAHYLLSIAYDTRLATIGVEAGDCTGDNCGGSAHASFSWFGHRSYHHALTLRFFDKADGHELYKVSATSEDHDADPLHAIPYLVKSALAQFPFDGHPDWRVKLRADETGGEPRVVSVKPLQP